MEIMEEHYCLFCQMCLNGDKAFEDHAGTIRHRANVNAWPGSLSNKKSHQRSKGIVIPKGTATLIEQTALHADSSMSIEDIMCVRMSLALPPSVDRQEAPALHVFIVMENYFAFLMFWGGYPHCCVWGDVPDGTCCCYMRELVIRWLSGGSELPLINLYHLIHSCILYTVYCLYNYNID